MTITKYQLSRWCDGASRRKARLARMIGTTRQMINHWVNQGHPIAEHWHEPIEIAIRNIELIERQHAEVVRQLAALREREIILRTA